MILLCLKIVLISGLLWGYYRLGLQNRNFHAFNRYYLLLLPIFSVLIALLRLKIPAFLQNSPNALPFPVLQTRGAEWLEEVTVRPGKAAPSLLISANTLLWGVYLAGLSIALFRFLLAFRKILQLLKSHSAHRLAEEIWIYPSRAKGTPFSFFNRIIWNEKIPFDSPEGDQILRHELYHVRHHHSRDLVFLEIFSCFLWFNPFWVLIKREIRAIHEFLADQHASGGVDRPAYAHLILKESLHAYRSSLLHPFFQNHLKRRILMLTQFSQKAPGWSGRLLVLPLALLLTGIFAFQSRRPLPATQSSHPLTLVIDAGHGGTDAGVVGSQGLAEKDLNLRIALKMAELAKEYQITPILTRTTDLLPGSSNQDIRESLIYRSQLASQSKADLFISIHINADNQDPSRSGAEIWISNRNTENMQGSSLLGSALSASLQKDLKVATELKKANQGVKVLDAATVPAVLVECGYLTNSGDEGFLKDPANLEKIARDLLEGVVQYQNARSHTLVNLEYLDALPSLGKGPAANGEAEDRLNSELLQDSVESQFPGGYNAWAKFLSQTLHYPDDAVNKEIQGDVVVQFHVAKDGTVSEVKAISGPKVLRAESVRVVQLSGKWEPATIKGVPVDSYKKQPIKYRLEIQKVK